MTKKVTILLLCVCLALCIAAPAMADYSYTITVYAGNQGDFVSGPVSSVQRDGALVDLSEIDVDIQADKAVISGLRYGDVVRFDVQDGSVAMDNGTKYYIRGMRLSGRDNSSTSYTAVTVTEDELFVVAYGVKGDMVTYTINYQDAATGETLAESQVRYGNVGEKPVEAYVYIEGYEPQAYNLTRTLSEDESQNIFTFYYTSVTTETPTPTATATPGGTVTATPRPTAAPGAEETPSPVFTPGAENETETGEDTETTAESTPAPEEPTGPQEIIDLDDPEIPLASAAPTEAPGGLAEEEEEDDTTKRDGASYLIWIVVGVVLAGLLAVLIIIDRRQQSRDDE